MDRYLIRYAGWTLVGASGLLSFAAGFSFGMFLMPLFLVALIVMVATRREEDGTPPQYPGVFLGMASITTLVMFFTSEWLVGLVPATAVLLLLALGLPQLSGDRKPTVG